jgi:nicotinamide riboside kinase
MKKEVFKIALLGPESTGKSTLAADLASHYQTLWCPEFARSFLPTLNKPYTKSDVLHCVDEQQKLESDVLNTATQPLVFFDTEMINLFVWLDYCYGDAPISLISNLKDRYDFYLLTSPDIPFEPDPLREHPDLRDYFFECYKTEVIKTGIPFTVIDGIGTTRFENAVRAVDHALKKHTE